MPKSFKKFREEWDSNEWGDDDDDRRNKDYKMKNRRQERREKVSEKYSKLDVKDEE